MIVTIDGPAGAGKSTVARALAERLGFRFLDTGAMYRAVAWAAVDAGADLGNPDQVTAIAERILIELVEDRVFVDGHDVSREIRTAAITAQTHFAANNPQVRAHLVTLQKQLGSSGNIVTEGRDQGTVVFPHAECKIFLTASSEERARRRMEDLAARGETLPFQQVLADQSLRDERDAGRTVGPLAAANDAIEVCTDGLSPEEVITKLESLVLSRRPAGYDASSAS